MANCRYDWVQIRIAYESGQAISALAREHGCTRKAIQKHLKREGWTRDITSSVRNLARSKVASPVPTRDPSQAAAIIEAEATKLAVVMQRHRDAWKDVLKLQNDAFEQARDGRIDAALKTARLAKTLAEVTAIVYAGERRSWGIEDGATRLDLIPDEDLDAAIEELEERVMDEIRAAKLSEAAPTTVQ